MSTNELTNLVNAAMQKDNIAMEKLYKEYYPDVLFVCQKFNLNKEDARDIAQETFITAFGNIDKLQDATKFRPWLTKIANNKCLDFLKHNRIISFESIDEAEGITELPDKRKSAEEIVVEKEISEILRDMIEKLPVEQRVTVFMFYYQDYSVKEIAAMYGCSENTVRSRLNYAKKFMQNEIDRLDNKDIKHRCIALLPFLFIIFQSERDVFACEIPSCTGVISDVMNKNKTAGNNAENVNTIPTASNATKVIKSSAGLSFGKIIAIVAVAVITGGIIAVVSFTGSEDEKPSKETMADSDDKKPSDKETENNQNIVVDNKAKEFLDGARKVLSDVKNIGITYDFLYGGSSEKESGYIGAFGEDVCVLLNTKDLVMESLVEDEFEITDGTFINTVDGKSYLYNFADTENSEYKKTELSKEELNKFNYEQVMNNLFDLVIENGAQLSELENGKKCVICNTNLVILDGVFDMIMAEKVATTGEKQLDIFDYKGEITIVFSDNLTVDHIYVESDEIVEEVAKACDHKVDEIKWTASGFEFDFAYDFAEATIPDMVELITDKNVFLANYEYGEASEHAVRIAVDNKNEKLGVSTFFAQIDYDDKMTEYAEDELIDDVFNGYFIRGDYPEIDAEDITWENINGYEVGITRAYDFARFEEERLLAVVKFKFPDEERHLYIHITWKYNSNEEDDARYGEAYNLMKEMVEAVEIIEIKNLVTDRSEQKDFIYKN